MYIPLHLKTGCAAICCLNSSSIPPTIGAGVLTQYCCHLLAQCRYPVLETGFPLEGRANCAHVENKVSIKRGTVKLLRRDMKVTSAKAAKLDRTHVHACTDANITCTCTCTSAVYNYKVHVVHVWPCVPCSVPGGAVHIHLSVWSSYIPPPQCPYGLESTS